MTPHEMIEDLSSIKLPAPKRQDVLGARALLQSQGALPLAMVTELRKLYNRHGKQIRALHEAREKARHSRARARMGLTPEMVQEREAKRLEDLRKKLTDLGI